ncbi:hypothetical protein MKW98_020083 [Papaver atlanticum]|uniref:BAR domain-containing protein n=1 Tax=Papaver atlanticum TaxID=357466 RepID=A0AAD4S1P8_9MAGN|nr:hypothetical protein MKW98_020083 [Papaver atlanticum]
MFTTVMKSSWDKLKGLAFSQHQNHNKKDDKIVNFHDRPCPTILDDFTQASKDLDDMKKRKDAILYAAAAAANHASAFSESLRKMGTCLLEQSALTRDEQSGNDLLVDSYRSHIFQIITSSESILNQLQTMEEMKQQCDEKRNVYQGLLVAQTKMEKSRSFKAKTDSPQQLQTASNEYEREAISFVSLLKSLKVEQTRSFLTQAVQHHATQISLFTKVLKSLEAIDLEVRLAAEHRHNDHNSSGLQDASLSGARNNLRYTSPLELQKRERNLRADKMKEINIERASNKLHPPWLSHKLSRLHELPSPPSTRNALLVQSAKVMRSQDLYSTIEIRLTPSNASSSYPLPTPLETGYPRGHHMPSSEARFCHSAPGGNSPDLYTKNENLPPALNASTFPKPPGFPKFGCPSIHYVHGDDGRAYHSAHFEISQDLHATSEIPWTPSNVTAYRLPLESELPRGTYIPLTDERAKAILGSFSRVQDFQ